MMTSSTTTHNHTHMATRICSKDRCPLYSNGACRHIREIGAPDGFRGRTFTVCERRANDKKNRK